MDFKNKVVLVTGASSGIGEETAKYLAELSAKVVLVARNTKELNRVAAECKGPEKPLIITADITKGVDVMRIEKETIAHFGKIDVLVNNAGAAFPDTISEPNLENFDKTINLNLRAIYQLTQLFAPHLAKTKGNIVNVSSIVATVPLIGNISYLTSKAGLDHFTRSTALELASKGVRVNIVSPGVTDTNFGVNAFKVDKEQVNIMLENMIKKIPLGKVVHPREIAYMIAYVASDLATSVTGATFVVDGGHALVGLT